MKVSAYIATSLDGFIARPDGALDWLPGAGDDEGRRFADGFAREEADYGWSAFWDSVDCLIMGRRSFAKVRTFGGWPYEGKRVLVLSRDPQFVVPEELAGKAEAAGAPPSLSALLKQLSAAGHRHIYVDGGQTIQAFLREGLITEMTVTRIPVLIGEGIPLFGPVPSDIPLTLVRSVAYANGFVQSVYTLSKPPRR